MALPATITPLSDRALILRFGDVIDHAINQRVLDAWRIIDANRPAGVVDLVPAYTTLAVHYDWQRMPEPARQQPWLWLGEQLRQRLEAGIVAVASQARIMPVPVCYEPEHAPDLAEVARHLGLTVDEVIARHSAGTYTVASIGFRPGFPYLLGLDPALAIPRLDTPRARVEAGSVGLAGQQTGIYPFAGAGGWRLIGATPRRLFATDRVSPSLLSPGDQVRFEVIDGATFAHLAAQEQRVSESPENIERRPVMPVLEVLSAGIHSSLQDAGRAGWRHLGIGASGCFDPVGAALANTLVGNDTDRAVLEMTIRGPDLRVLRPVTMALTGSGMSARVDDTPLRFGQPVTLPAGAVLRFRASGHGARAWLAVAGGLEGARWLGSVAHDTGSGLHGQLLRAGNRLATMTTATPSPNTAAARWWLDTDPVPDVTTIRLRFVGDADANADVIEAIARPSWRVDPAADRTGLRLRGEAMDIADGGTRISQAVLPGTIQIPPNGQPIILGPDCQTIGGYPVVGHVIESDLGRLAQCKPGDYIELQPVDLGTAHALRREQVAAKARQDIAIAAKRSESD